MYVTLQSTGSRINYSIKYFKAITTRSGSPIDLLKPSTIPTTNRSWKDLLPQALCIGPLNQLSVSTKLESKSITRRSKEIESILAAQKKHFKSTVVKEVTTVKQDDNLDGSTSKARAGRSSRVCKKCPAGEDGLQPFKPGLQNYFLSIFLKLIYFEIYRKNSSL